MKKYRKNVQETASRQAESEESAETIPGKRRRGVRLNSANKILNELGRIYGELRRGEITPELSGKLTYVLNVALKACELMNVESRMENIDQRITTITERRTCEHCEK